MSRIDGDVDNIEINRSVADDASHRDRRLLPEDMYAITAMRQSGSGAFQGRGDMPAATRRWQNASAEGTFSITVYSTVMF